MAHSTCGARHRLGLPGRRLSLRSLHSRGDDGEVGSASAQARRARATAQGVGLARDPQSGDRFRGVRPHRGVAAGAGTTLEGARA